MSASLLSSSGGWQRLVTICLSQRGRRVAVLLLLSAFFVLSGLLGSQSVFAEAPSAEISSLGTGGVFRVGLWTEARLRVRGGSEGVSGKLQVTLPDGDGFPTNFSADELANIRVGQGETAEFILPVKLGRAEGHAKLEILAVDGQAAISRKFPINELGRALSPLQQIYVSIGQHQGLDAALKLINRGTPDDEKPILITLDSLENFPTQWQSSEGIDLVFWSTSGLKPEEIPAEQLIALQRWVNLGGRLVMTVGEEGAELIGVGQPLDELAPGNFLRAEKLFSSVRLESYISAKGRLLNGSEESIPISVIEYEGIVEFSEQGVPLIVSESVGFGQVVLAAFALDRPPFKKWDYRDRLLANILELAAGRPKTSRLEKTSGRVVHIGYSDISGQLRAALDKFSQVSFINFTLVAVLTVVYILCIGPGDYFLLRNVLGKMELTWLTFPLITVLFGAAAVVIYHKTKTDQLQVNQVEIIDVDSSSGLARGTIWSHVYSPVTQTVDLAYVSPSDSTIHPQEVFFSWNGFPGRALGGMSGNISTRAFQASYDIDRSTDRGEVVTRINQIPLQVSSTKAFTARWAGQFEQPITSNLWSFGPDRSLQGSFVNPFDLVLSEAVLLYGQGAYVLGRDLAAHETISVGGEMDEKSLDGYLTRRKLVDSKDVTPPWDPASLNTPRIIELMMFYTAAGGDQYTNLSQRFHFGTDLTSQLDANQAILMCRTKKAVHRLAVNGQELRDEYDQQWTFYRVILPVEIRAR